ncbi:hypothetical protein NG800_001965 [Epilithonimonas ginsengisoli]|uniref:Uncharacterized protein n=1 Tax=Epilithonimonas ginsengisoli TaxID=1245592 RepID=A0ABU4JDB6_9FLAO|nr:MULTISPECIES: hypothetical protein [Chryseobacterium group]MBV6878632.1 hypothetical protein [Epilithonimonas sp. FP105]MDW8547657.1 hypothetical protein [Epilithonimonas ginsengisoli]OAH75247.1 hypothetical protein AXA65_04575 [Chryseobacterium sp. FP211-J200]
MINLKNQIKSQIIELENLLGFANNDPFMSKSLSMKIKILEDKLENLTEEVSEAIVSLLFSGNAVSGSRGIKIDFVSKVLKPFQELVKTETTKIKYGIVGKRGKTKDIDDAELYLTALPTGSFGVQLTQLNKNNIFSETEVDKAIENVINLVNAATNSDETFEEIVAVTPPRSLNNLKSFLKEIDNENSILKFEKDNETLEISTENIHKGYERINSAITDEEVIEIRGTLRGVLLDSGKFEFVDENGHKVSGLIGEDIDEDKIIELSLEYLNKSCTIHLKKIKTKFVSQNEKTFYHLIDIFP